LRTRFTEAASVDLKEARAFAATMGRQARKRLNAELRKAIALLREQPQAGKPVGRTLREYVVDLVPYSLIYAIEEDEIVISVIRHHSRNPTFWHDRFDPER
jgi:plasmid stabilization system protein ParE